jgi:hypothetical protein
MGSRDFELFAFVSLGSRQRDGRRRIGDAVLVRKDGELLTDVNGA